MGPHALRLLSLAPDKWVSSHVVSMMAWTLTAMGGHRYYFDATFGEEVCNFKANRKKPQVDIVAHFGRFFLSDFKEFELTRRWMFSCPYATRIEGPMSSMSGIGALSC